MLQAESTVLDFVQKENRPYNVQLVADMLAQFGIKKPQVQRALEALAEQEKLTCKEFGKTKIYFSVQQAPPDNEREEVDKMTRELQELKEAIQTDGEAVQAMQKEVTAQQSTLTDAELEDRIQKLQHQVSEADGRLKGMQDKTNLVSQADWDKVEKAASANVAMWAKRRRAFKEIWEMMTENMDSNPKNLLADLGVETDEAQGLAVSQFQQLVAKRPRH